MTLAKEQHDKHMNPETGSGRCRILAERWWMAGIFGLVALRLLLTADHDILALNAPFDEYWFIHRARNLVWRGPYDHMMFAQLPIYSVWLLLLALFGIPARLGIDVAWILAVGYLGYSVWQFTRQRWVGALIFTYLLFQPFSLVIFDRALSETLVAVLCAAVLGAGIEIWNCRDRIAPFRRRIALVVYILGFAAAFHTRKEGVVLLVPLIALAAWSLWDRRVWWRGMLRQRLGMSMLVAPVAATVLLGTFLAGVNYFHFGIFARYELAAPGYQHAMAALNQIDVGRTPAQVTVTARARALVYDVSPTFRELQPFFEGAEGQNLAAYTAEFTGVPGEIGNGWFYWAIRNFAAEAGWHKTAKFAESKYAAVAEEIGQAFASGRLTRRPYVVSPFIDPDIGKWIGGFPGATAREFGLLIRPDAHTFASPEEDALPHQLAEYIVVAGRRRPLPLGSVKGWAIAPAGSLIGLGNADSAQVWATLSGPPRPDVPGGIPFQVTAYGVDGPLALHLQTPDGRKGAIALSKLSEGKVAYFEGAANATVGIDQVTNVNPSYRIDDWSSHLPGLREPGSWLVALCTLYGWMGSLLCLAVVAGCARSILRGRPWSPLLLILAALGLGILARAMLLALLDVSSWSGAQARYLLPVVPAFACAGGLALALLFPGAHPDRDRGPAPGAGGHL